MASPPVTESLKEQAPPVSEDQLMSDPQQDQTQQPENTIASVAAESKDETKHPPPSAADESAKWPGWPGHNVFRLIVPLLKVGGIIGRKGELVKKMCEETRARIRILEGPVGTADRIVLISGKEEPYAPFSPAMDAVVRVFKCVVDLSPSEGTADKAAATSGFCSVRLLVASSQAIHLIGKQGSTIKSIQESSNASVRVLSEDEVPSCAASDERIVEIHGDALKVLKALEGVLGQLRKFLVDHSVVPVFEKTRNATISQDYAVDPLARKNQSLLHPVSSSAPASGLSSAVQGGIGSNFSLSLKRDSLLSYREAQFDSKVSQTGLSLHGQDPGLGALRSTAVGRTSAPIVTQMTKRMQVPLSYAEDIIGIGGTNIGYIRRTSGAILTVEETRGLPDEITVEIKGTSSQVQMAEQLIQEFLDSHRESITSMYGSVDSGLSSYSRLSNNSYSSASFSSQRLGGGYGSSSFGGYNSFRF